MMIRLAYSYIRFSQATQSRGGSLERQMAIAADYIIRKGLTLDTKLNMSDLGVSGFDGKNVAPGAALGGFVVGIQQGLVPPGSYLLIEDIDRLSRMDVMSAFTVFKAIIDGGVTIVVLKNEQEYSNESLKNDWVGLMPLIVSMGRAHEESTRKSTLLGRAWKKKKEAAAAQKKPMGNNAPMWLEYVKEDKANGIKACYRPIPDRVSIVKRIFQLSIDGRGRTAIATILNTEGIRAFKGGEWGTTQISRILSSRAVLGEYQPKTKRIASGDPVKDYFEPILDESSFNQAQAANRSRYIHRVTKTTPNFNVWAGVAKCALCGDSMYSIRKGKAPNITTGKTPNSYSYLSCASNRKGVCKAKPIRIEATELIYQEILAKVGDKSLSEDKNAAIASSLAAKQGQLAIEHATHASTQEIFNELPSKAVAATLIKQETLIEQLNVEIADLKLSLAEDTIVDKSAFLAAIDLTSRDIRQKSNELLKRLNIIVKIDGEANHYRVEQDQVKILDIFSSKELGVLFYPATPATSNAVWDQEGDFMPTYDPDPSYIEDGDLD